MKNAQAILDLLKEASEGYLEFRSKDPNRVDKQWSRLVEELVDRARAMGMPPEQESIVCSMLYAAEESYCMKGDIA